MNKLISRILILTGHFLNAQEDSFQKEVLSRYDNGQVMREHIKIPKNDTVLERVYYENGQLNLQYQLVGGQRNGDAYTYRENGDLLFEEVYRNGKFDGQFKCFYPDGSLQWIKNYNLDHLIDTSTFFNQSGTIIRKVIYNSPCPSGSSECDKTVIEYEKGIQVYSYLVKGGLKSEDHEVFNDTLYNELMQAAKEIPKLVKGKSLYMSNCAMCHRIEKPVVGPALNEAIKGKSDQQLYDIIVNSDTHPRTKLSREEYDALIEFLRTESR